LDLDAIRDYALKEWYKRKAELTISAFLENEYQNNIKKLYHYTKGNNSDSENINVARRRGVFN